MATEQVGDGRPAGRAGPLRIALLSVHTSPLSQPGSGDSGGMNVYLAQVSRELVRTGNEVDVYTRATGGDLPPVVQTAAGYRVHHLRAGPPGSRKEDLANHLCGFSFALRSVPRFREADIVHGHYWLSGWVARRLARCHPRPFVQTFHTLARDKNAALAAGDVPETALRLAAEQRIARAADAVIAPTEAEADTLVSAYGTDPAAVQVIAPGVDLTTFRPDGDRAVDRRALGGGRLLLFVGRLQPLKAPDVAVRTLAALDGLLPDDGVPARLIVCGGPSGSGIGRTDVDRLRRLARRLGVEDRVAFLAPRPHPELAALYRAADVVVMPSRSESFGLVALEAQACGTPVVAADVGGLAHAVTTGGTLVPGHDPVDHARAVLPYLRDPALREATGRAGVRHARRHGWERTAHATLDRYHRLHRAPAGPATAVALLPDDGTADARGA